MRIAIVETGYPLNSRTIRFYNSFVQAFGKENVKIICWNRVAREISEYYDQDNIYDVPAEFGDRIKKLKALNGFRKFVEKRFRVLHPEIILASHWDSLLITSLCKPRGSFLIYENLDMPTGSLLVRMLLRSIEKMALRKVDCITFASRFYKPYYKDFNGETFIIENKLPKELCVSLPQKEKIINNEKIVITFLGVIRYIDVLKRLVQAVGDIEQVELRFYGTGPDLNDLKESSLRFSNIKFFGRYNYTQIPQIYSTSDVIWAAYPSNDFNVKQAISNKYHESLHFHVPAIFSKDTSLGKYVDNNRIGLTVDCYSLDDIRNLIFRIVHEGNALYQRIVPNIFNMAKIENGNWEEEIYPLIYYLRKRGI